MIIDSLSSPAAAVSFPHIAVPCSWFYALYTKPGDSKVYYTSANNSNATCNNASPPNNNSGTPTITCNSVQYTLPAGGTVPTAGGSPAIQDASCSSFIVISGTTIHAIGGATTLAGFSRPSNPAVCSPCPSTSSDNQLTVCNDVDACDNH